LQWYSGGRTGLQGKGLGTSTEYRKKNGIHSCKIRG
jgi:hypothetical protein